MDFCPKIVGNPNSTSYSLTYLNHSFTESVVIASKDKADGYFYFPCDNGNNSNRANNDFTLNDFQCGIYEHTILKNIFDSVGIKTKGTMFNDPLYYQTIITNAKKIAGFSVQNQSKSFTPVEGVQLDKSTFQPIQFPNSDQDPQWNGNTFTAGYDIDDFRLYLKLEGYRDGALGSTNIDIKIEYTINGVPQPDIITFVAQQYTKVVGGITYVSLFEYKNLSDFQLLKVGDTIKVYVRENAAGADNYFLTTSNYFNNAGETKAYLRYEIIDAVAPYEAINVLPKIKQTDFVKDIMFRLGVVPDYDPKKRVLSLNKFEDLEKNKSQYKDFTNKIDLSKDIEIDFTKAVQNYFKTSFLRYKDDDNDTQLRLFKTVAKDGLGDGRIVIENDNLSDEGNIFESVYSATKDVYTFPLSGTDFNFYLPYIPFLNISGEEQDLSPRVLIAVRDTKVSSFSNTYSGINIGVDFIDVQNIGYAYFAKQNVKQSEILSNELDTNLSTLSFENYTLAGQTYFGNTLIEKNFNLFNKIINNPITVPIHLKLNELDVNEYNPLVPVWLDFKLDSGFYYLEEISQYKGDGSTTKCNLVKI